MGEPPCTLLQAEMALDLLEGELATELPAHMRAFARAYATGRPPPPAPLLARLPSSLKTAREALAHELLADRGAALLRLVVPLVIDVPVPAERTWPAYAAFAAARDRLAREKFGHRVVELMQALHGGEPGAGQGGAGGAGHGGAAGAGRGGGAGAGHGGAAGAGHGGAAGTSEAVHDIASIPAAVQGWQDPGPAIDDAAILDVWQLIASRHGIAGNVRVDRGDPDVGPRTFVVVPRAEVIIVVPAVIATPRARTQVLHELGHAAAALTLPAGIPRAVDEAAASYIARLAEPASWLPAQWTSELATAARARRRAIASVLDAIECTPTDPHGLSAPPPALFDDPGAQSSYVAAEIIADRLVHELGQNPPRGQLARALAAEADRVTWRTCELRWH